MWSKARLIVLGFFLVSFAVVELVALLTPALRCEGRMAIYEGLSQRLGVLHLALLLVGAIDVLLSWRQRKAWSEDPAALRARAEKLQEKSGKASGGAA